MKTLRRICMAALIAAATVAWPEILKAQSKATGANPIIILETTKGTIEFEVYPEDAPKTVTHILALMKRNFYNGLRIHRVEKGFVVQWGDPQTRDMTKRDRWGTGGSGRTVGVAEIAKKRTHRRGAVGMAHAGDPVAADSQMYIMLSNRPALDGKYAVIGQVVAGMDIVDKIEVADVIRKVSVKAGDSQP